MCMMCLKYRIILLIVIKNPWKYLLTHVLLRGAAPYPAGGAYSAPQTPTFGGSHIEHLTRSASTVSPSSDYSGVERWRHLTRKVQRKHRRAAIVVYILEGARASTGLSLLCVNVGYKWWITDSMKVIKICSPSQINSPYE